jgi:Domain of unknown function (DUF4352)
MKMRLIAVALVALPAIAGCASSADHQDAPQTSGADKQATTSPSKPSLRTIKLHVLSPDDGITTYDGQLTIAGRATAGASIMVGDAHADTSSLGRHRESFQASVQLDRGDNPITITASKPGYKDRSAALVVTRKKRPPTIGTSLMLGGDSTDVRVKFLGVIDPLPAGEFDTPDAGKRLVGVQVAITNVGDDWYDDSPSNGAALITDSDEQADSTIVTEGPCGGEFSSSAKIAPGSTQQGCIAFEVPAGASLKTFQFTQDSGFGPDTGEWHVQPTA